MSKQAMIGMITGMEQAIFEVGRATAIEGQVFREFKKFFSIRADLMNRDTALEAAKVMLADLIIKENL